MIPRIALLAAAIATGGSPAETIREAPFLCNLKALSAAERAEHLERSRRLAQAVLNIVEISEGYAFQIDSARFSIRELVAWTDFEQRCCPFFDFAVELRRESGPMTLRLTGREGVKRFIRTEFPGIIPQ